MENYNLFPRVYCYFKNQIEKYYLPEMITSIGIIDLEQLESREIESLYYLFPLVEKIIIEILKYKEDANIEFYSQGTYRTLNSIFTMEENKKYFNENLINLIKEYYGENGLRNQILHFRGYIQIEITTTDLLAVKIIVVKL